MVRIQSKLRRERIGKFGRTIWFRSNRVSDSRTRGNEFTEGREDNEASV
jgi:hypothetical protein